MPTPRADSYSIASGAGLWAGVVGAPPSWLVALAAGELGSISGTSPSASAGVTPAVSGSMGSQSNMVNAWGGAFLRGSSFCIHGGGHADYGGNEIAYCDLAANEPAWDLYVERTPVASLLGGSNYYADGLPTSRHTYYAMFVAVVDGVEKLLRFNANMGFAFNGTPVGGDADVRTTAIDAFNFATHEWEPAAYGPMPRITGSGTAAAQHPSTGDVYVWDVDQVITVYAVSSDEATDLADLSGTEGSSAALVVDAVNNRLVRFAGNATGGVVYWPLSGGSKTTPSLTGSGAAALTAAMSGSQGGWGRGHDTRRNHVYLYTGASTIFRVDLANFSVVEVSPAGETLHTPSNAWWGRVQYLRAQIPEYDAIVSLASWSSEIQALRVL